VSAGNGGSNGDPLLYIIRVEFEGGGVEDHIRGRGGDGDFIGGSYVEADGELVRFLTNKQSGNVPLRGTKDGSLADGDTDIGGGVIPSSIGTGDEVGNYVASSVDGGHCDLLASSGSIESDGGGGELEVSGEEGNGDVIGGGVLEAKGDFGGLGNNEQTGDSS